MREQTFNLYCAEGLIVSHQVVPRTTTTPPVRYYRSSRQMQLFRNFCPYLVVLTLKRGLLTNKTTQSPIILSGTLV